MMSENPKKNDRYKTAGGTGGDHLMWEYACRTCKMQFSTTVPQGPAEEAKITCTGCGSREIGRINVPVLRDTELGA